RPTPHRPFHYRSQHCSCEPFKQPSHEEEGYRSNIRLLPGLQERIILVFKRNPHQQSKYDRGFYPDKPARSLRELFLFQPFEVELVTHGVLPIPLSVIWVKAHPEPTRRCCYSLTSRAECG